MRTTTRRIVILLVVLGLGLAAGLVPGVLGADRPGADEVLFESASSRGPDPFTDAAVVETSGPFGGTGEDRCDRELLIAFLGAHPDRMAAWAAVQRIEVAEVPDFIRSLTPKVLTEDTRVTNHGFKDGEAYAFQSVLEAGTAVLVDDEGKIVVRCRCGNPLREPKCPPGCEPPGRECPEDPTGRLPEHCEPPTEECPEDPVATHARPECDPPTEECPEDPVATHVPPGCDPPPVDCEPVPGAADCDPPPVDCQPVPGAADCPDPTPRPRPRPNPTPDPVDPRPQDEPERPRPTPDDEPDDEPQRPRPTPTPDGPRPGAGGPGGISNGTDPTH